MSERRVAVFVLGAEAALGLAWWLALLAEPSLGRLVLPDAMPAGLILTFALPDFVSYAVAPAAAAAGLAGNRRWALPVVWLHAGAAIYAALWGWGTVLASGQGLLAAALMTPSALVAPTIAARLSR